MKLSVSIGVLLTTLSFSVLAASEYAGTWTGRYIEGTNILSTLKVVEVSPGKFHSTLYLNHDGYATNTFGEYDNCRAMIGGIDSKSKKLVLKVSGWLAGRAESDSGGVISAAMSGGGLSVSTNFKHRLLAAKKSANSFVLKRSDYTQLPTRCEVDAPLLKVEEPSKETQGFVRAISTGNLDVAEIYLNKGADINCVGCAGHPSYLSTPLTMALSSPAWGKINTIRWLLEHGADANLADGFGRTPLMFAADWNQRAVMADFQFKEANLPPVTQGDSGLVIYLLNHGAKLGDRDLHGENAYSYLATFRAVDGVSRVNALKVMLSMLRGGDVNNRNSFGETLLTAAIKRCTDASIPLILAEGADTNIKDGAGQLPVDIALEMAQSNRQECNNTLKIMQDPNAYIPKNSDPRKLL
jgi:ankyrin repeat protein